MKFWISLLFISTAALGQNAEPLKNATVNDLVEKLSPPVEQARTRSLGGRNLSVAPKSIDLVIQFDLDSAKLKEPSKPLLDNLASAMKNERLANMRFKVEGHTDAQGTEDYNRKLSLERAQSVLTYLAAQGIDKDRLTEEGKGFSELLLPEKPKAPENRRVRITTQP
jgi:outer membrane protein OmpA-like peptidoglycan-associated protein